MSKEDSSSIGKFLLGMLAGVALTFVYVRFGVRPPGVFGIPQKISEAAIVTTAEIDLYDPNKPKDVRKRALAVVVGQDPELFMEVDAEIGDRFFDEVMRRKAFRKAKLLKTQHGAYDVALDKPALRQVLERKYCVTESDALKQQMLLANIRKDLFLYAYLTRRFPGATDDQLAYVVLGVYGNELREPGSSSNSDGERVSDRRGVSPLR